MISKYGNNIEDYLNQKILKLIQKKDFSSEAFDEIDHSISQRIAGNKVSPKTRAKVSKNLKSKQSGKRSRKSNKQAGKSFDQSNDILHNNLMSHNQSYDVITNQTNRNERNSKVVSNEKHFSQIGHKKSAVTGKTTPLKNLRLDVNVSQRSNNGEGTILPMLQPRSPLNDQGQLKTVNPTLHNSLYSRGFRTPVKKYIPTYDAKVIEDSKVFLISKHTFKLLSFR